MKNKEKKINYKIVGTKELENCEAEISCEIAAEDIATFRPKAITKIQKDLSLPGFRPGHVPEAMLIKHVGDLFIYNEMAEMAINESFADIILETKTNFIGMPNIQLTKIANNSPVAFKIVGPVMPEFKLPNYKKIAKAEADVKPEPAEATEKEVEETIEEIKKQRPDFKEEDGFRNKVKDRIKQEKEFKAKDKKRLAIIEKIISETKLSLPKILIDSEVRKMQAQFEDDIARAGLKVDDYLKHLNKTKEDLNKEWAPDALKRAKLQLIITKIALEEKLEPEKSTVDAEVEKLLKIYKDATEDRTRAYVEMMLTNEKVFEWLENQK
jgi:FKBP-type peptidyl-prolyl cis-trans isomerase (trigger factor)